MIAYRRPVRLEEVDIAKIVFFVRFSSYAHEAMENFFGALDGGYVALLTVRNTCFTTVRMESNFEAPLRYGTELVVETSVTRIGNRSATLRYGFARGDGTPTAVFLHTVVTLDMRTLTSCDMPADVRALLEKHLSL